MICNPWEAKNSSHSFHRRCQQSVGETTPFLSQSAGIEFEPNISTESLLSLPANSGNIPGSSAFERINLSPFTKDFRAGGHLWAYPIFGSAPSGVPLSSFYLLLLLPSLRRHSFISRQQQ
jgi:hypothetical protein